MDGCKVDDVQQMVCGWHRCFCFRVAGSLLADARVETMKNNFIYTDDSITKSFESCALVAYHGAADSPGLWTIGWGHTAGVQEGDTCTQEQADEWLLEDAASAAGAVNRLVTVPISQNEFNALTDFVFNTGEHAFAMSTMLRLLNAGDHQGAASEFQRWVYSDGQKVAGLLRRRVAEETLFRSGP